MRGYFTGEEQKLFDRVKVFVTLIAEHELHSEPCPLLVSQLQELSVFAGQIEVAATNLKDLVADDE